MATISERVGIVEQRMNDHETRCEERMKSINATANNTLQAVESLKTRAWGIAAAMLAWALVQVWSQNDARVKQLEAPHSPPAAVRSIDNR